MSEFIIADDHSDDEFAAAPAPVSDAPIVLGEAPAPAAGGDDLFGGLSEEKPVVNEFGDDFGISAPATEAPIDLSAAPIESNDFGFSFVSEESPLR